MSPTKSPPRRFDQFPAEFWELVESNLGESPIEITGDRRALISLRQQLYLWARAIRETPREDLVRQILELRLGASESSPEQLHLARVMAHRAYLTACSLYLSLRGKNGSHTLLITNRSAGSPAAALLRQGLAPAPPTPDPVPTKLQDLLKRKDPK